MLAVVKDAVGELLPPNQIIYRNAFDNVSADVVYTYRKSGLEQDVILRQCPPDPEEYGLLAEATRLEVLTEFFEAPTPGKQVRVLDRVEDPELRLAMAEPDWTDEELDFGSFQMAEGRALSLSEWLEGRTAEPPIPVGKRWVEDGGRTILFESADYWSLASALGALPASDRDPRIGRVGQCGDWKSPPERLAVLVPADEPGRVAQRSIPRRTYRVTAAVPSGSRPATEGRIQKRSEWRHSVWTAAPGFTRLCYHRRLAHQLRIPG